MKKLICFLALFAAVVAQAQTKEGRVVYERVLQFPAPPGGMDPDLAARIPRSRSDQFELLFANNQSLLQILPSLNADEGTFSGNGSMMIRFAGGTNDITYHNFNTGMRVDQQEVMDKNFIVTDSIRRLDWKLSDETKTILNHTAHKATAHRTTTRARMTMENGEMKRQEFPDTALVVAWYTTDIPVSAGPDFQGQLPGLILELDIDKGQNVWHALDISPKVNASKIKEPKDGKKVTAEEMRKERIKIMEEMRRNMPPGANMRIQQ